MSLPDAVAALPRCAVGMQGQTRLLEDTDDDTIDRLSGDRHRRIRVQCDRPRLSLPERGVKRQGHRLRRRDVHHQGSAL
jgi:hypothetical protein